MSKPRIHTPDEELQLATTEEERNEALIDRGANYLGKKEYQLAKDDFLTVLKSDPEYTIAKEYYNTAIINEIFDILDTLTDDKDVLIRLKEIIREKLLKEFMLQERRGVPPLDTDRAGIKGGRRKSKKSPRKGKRSKKKRTKKKKGRK